MRLILFHLLPFLCLGQYLSSEKKIEFNSYFDDGKEIIEKSWIEDGQSISLVEISSNEGTDYRYYISDGGIEVGAYLYPTRDYGKYFKVDVTIVNNSNRRINFLPSEIEVSVKGNVRNLEKYTAVSYDDYSKKVERRQKGNEFWTAFATGLSAGLSGNSYSQSNTYGDYGYSTTYTTTYSPALTDLQLHQGQENLSRLQQEQDSRMKFISEGYLKKHTLFSNTTLEGYFLIPFHRNITSVAVVFNIAGKTFDFSNTKFH